MKIQNGVADLWVSTMIKRDIVYGVVDYVKNILLSCHYSPKLADIPLQVTSTRSSILSIDSLKQGRQKIQDGLPTAFILSIN